MSRRIEKMPDRIMGKSINYKVIPTMCNLNNMLTKLRNVYGDYNQLKPWEKRSYKAYNIEDIKSNILESNRNEWPNIMRQHILTGNKNMFGASCIDVYLVGYVASEYGVGKDVFTKYVLNNNITQKMNTVNAIWSVGKGDGIYLGILNKDGSIKDVEFIEKWIAR